jgi:hypothetical protein
MLRFHRRAFAILAALIGVAPLVTTVLTPSGRDGERLEDWRLAAPAPQLPQELAELAALPPSVDAYLADHFGLRGVVIRGYSILAHAWLGDSTAKVLVGENGWLFLRADDMVRQSAGLLIRRDRIGEMADAIAELRDALHARGIRFVFASPPNSATIYPDMLPQWARSQGRVTEYDLMLTALAARHVSAVDLRPVLREARASGDVYFRHDSHWNDRGRIAGFNAVSAAVGHPDWHLDPSTALLPPASQIGGDLAHLLGLRTDLSEPVQLLDLPKDEQELLTPQPFATYRSASATGGGLTVMVMGDSFTEGQFGRMVLAHAAQYLWTHDSVCNFDWKWIDRFRPAEVWYMPTERATLCGPGGRPILSGPSLQASVARADQRLTEPSAGPVGSDEAAQKEH